MKKHIVRVAAVCMLTVFVVVAAGCGGGSGGSGLHRLVGLTPDATVKTFFTAAKNGNLEEASLYVANETKSNAQTLVKFLTGQNGMEQIKNSNIISIKNVVAQGDYAVVMATLQPDMNSLNLVVRPVGLEKVNDEWYIVDFDQIYNNAKYAALKALLEKI